MKINKWDILFGGLFYALPLWLILIPISLFEKNDNIVILAVVCMVAFWGEGMTLVRNNYLEEEVEQLKKKLNENK